MNHLRTLSLGKKTRKDGLSRRQLLRALGVSAAAAPLVPSLDGWAATTGPQRLLLLFTPDGIVPERYWPEGSETNFSFPANSILAPLAAHKQDMIVFKDLKRYNGGNGGAHEHAMGGLWTGNSIRNNNAAAESCDQIIANGLTVKSDFQSLQFGVMAFYDKGSANAKAASPNSYMIFGKGGSRIPAESDPYKMFDRIFGGWKAPTPGAAPAPAGPSPEMERIRAEKKSILDFLSADLDLVRGKVGKDDGAKIEAHHETIRDIERRLAGQVGGPIMAGAACTQPSKPQMIDLANNGNLPALCTLTNKLVVAALACDRSRVMSLQYSRGFSNAVHTWVGAKETHHTLSHGTQNKPVLADIQIFYMKHIAQLLDDIKAVKENGVSMLDNMLVCYGNEVHAGWTHGVDPEPCFWVGKAGGAIKATGRYYDCSGGRGDHNQMMQTMAAIMGVKVDKIGDLGKPGILPNII